MTFTFENCTGIAMGICFKSVSDIVVFLPSGQHILTGVSDRQIHDNVL